MSALLKLFAILGPALYTLAWANYGRLFYRDDPFARRTATPLLLVAWSVHLAGVCLTSAAYRRCPMGNLGEVLAVLVAAVVGVYLIVERRQGNKYTGFFLLSLMVPVAILSSVIPAPASPTSPLLRSPFFSLHTLLAIIGYSSFGVSAVYGVMFLLLYRSLKRQAFGLVFHKLPSLDGLAGMTLTAAIIGFCALGLTILFGAVWGSHALRESLLSRSVWADPKIYLTTFVWLLYGIGIAARVTARWASRPVVIWFLAAFVLTILIAVALNTVVPTFHDFNA